MVSAFPAKTRPSPYPDVIRCVYPDVIEPCRLHREPAPVAVDLQAQLALGTAVKARREALGLTQEQLSLKSGLHQRWISNVETGKRNPSYASIRRLAGGLEWRASELIAAAEVVSEQ